MAGPWVSLKISSSLATRVLFRLVRNPKMPNKKATVMNGPV